MGKRNLIKKSKKGSRAKLDTTIVVAVIGLIGTLLTALLASPVLISWIEKTDSSKNTPTDSTSQAVPITATNASIEFNSTLTPTPTGSDWKSIISMQLYSSCYPRLLPPTINPNEDITIAAQQFTQARNDQQDTQWLIAPNETGEYLLVLKMLSIVAGTGEILLDNKLKIDVTAKKDLPDHVDVINYGSCGAIGEIRTFSDVSLSNSYDSYVVLPGFADAPHFTLNPGEFEIFSIPFQCKSTGIYYLNINVGYEFLTISKVTDSDEMVGFICPQTFTAWNFDEFSHQFLSSETYHWNGSGYE